eukprot:2648656-Amphidinium_carterae.1
MLSFASLLGELIAKIVLPVPATGGAIYTAYGQSQRATGMTYLRATNDSRLRVAIFDLIVRAAHALDFELMHLVLSDPAKTREEARPRLYPPEAFHTGWMTQVTCRYAVIIDNHVGDLYVLFSKHETRGLLRGGYTPRSREIVFRFIREIEAEAQMQPTQATPPHSLRILTIPYPRDPHWEPPHAVAVQTTAEILMQLTSRRSVILREQAGVNFYDTGPPFQAPAVTIWHLPVDNRVREVLMFALARGARALRLSMVTFSLRRQQIRRGIATRLSDFNTRWMTTCNGAYAIIISAARDDLVVFYREPLHQAIRGGSYMVTAGSPRKLTSHRSPWQRKPLAEAKASCTPRKRRELRPIEPVDALMPPELQKCSLIVHERTHHWVVRTPFAPERVDVRGECYHLLILCYHLDPTTANAN